MDAACLAQHARQIDSLQSSDVFPRKSAAYFVSRFHQHPIYQYDIVGVFRNDQLCGLVVIRCAEADGARALRVVDCCGQNDVAAIPSSCWQGLLAEYDAEYVDLYAYGPSEVAARGMTRLDPSGEIVIPNHFEPLLQQNVTIRWAYKGPSGTRIQVVKADADQDRPNRLP